MDPLSSSPHSRSDQTREALLRAGTDLFAERGFEGVTVEQIARQAGVNKALISYHFGGKRGLYTAIIATTFDGIREALARLTESGEPPESLLGRLLDELRALAEERRPGFPALLLREAIAPGDRFCEDIAPHLAAMVGAVRAIIQRGIEQGCFRPVDPVQTHLAMIGAMAFFFATRKGRDQLARRGVFPVKAPTGEAFVETMKGLLLHGLAAPRGDIGGHRSNEGE